MQLKKILIVTTPRTGSNLLLDSLAHHHQAITGGEWLATEPLRFNSPKAISNIESGADCNLYKVFASQLHDTRFEILSSQCECVIHLYRRDVDAQVRSWLRACRTGIWVKDQPCPNPSRFPLSPVEHVLSSRIPLNSISTLSICYETMVANWDATISYILSCAGWEQATLPQAHSQMRECEATQAFLDAGNLQDDR